MRLILDCAVAFVKMGKKSKNNKLVKAHSGPKRTVMNPLIKELYKMTADPSKPANLDEVFKLGEAIQAKQSSFIAPSYNVDRVSAGNALIDHIKTWENLIL